MKTWTDLIPLIPNVRFHTLATHLALKECEAEGTCHDKLLILDIKDCYILPTMRHGWHILHTSQNLMSLRIFPVRGR
jgi:hypothetical protein